MEYTSNCKRNRHKRYRKHKCHLSVCSMFLAPIWSARPAPTRREPVPLPCSHRLPAQGEGMSFHSGQFDVHCVWVEIRLCMVVGNVSALPWTAKKKERKNKCHLSVCSMWPHRWDTQERKLQAGLFKGMEGYALLDRMPAFLCTLQRRKEPLHCMRPA